MKIEKINENQIRCTLTREDLASREIRLTELAYGSDKARALFQDMMQQAFEDCGFEASNTPLMIEAVPVSADSIILIITKVESPDELDSRFSRFSPEEDTLSGSSSGSAESLTGLDDILNLVARLTKARKMLKDKDGSPAGEEKADGEANASPAGCDASADAGSPDENAVSLYQLTRFYLFRDLPTILRAAAALDTSYSGISSLFKNPEDGNYYLILQKGDTDAELFNKVCNVLSEYSLAVDYIPGTQELFSEHMETILKENALSALRAL